MKCVCKCKTTWPNGNCTQCGGETELSLKAISVTLACEDYSGELTTIRQQLTEAKAEVDSLRLTLIETQAELQRHNAIMVDNGVRAEKAESDLVSFLQTLEVRAEDNRFLRQENKRLLAEVEKFKNQYSGGL